MARQTAEVRFIDRGILLQDARLRARGCPVFDDDGLRSPSTGVECAPNNGGMQVPVSCIKIRTGSIHAAVLMIGLFHRRCLAVVGQLASIWIERSLLGLNR